MDYELQVRLLSSLSVPSIMSLESALTPLKIRSTCLVIISKTSLTDVIFAWSLILTEFLNQIILAKNKELKDGELAGGVRKMNIAYQHLAKSMIIT